MTDVTGDGWVVSRRFERSLSLIVSLFAVLFALQAVGSLIADWSWLVLGADSPSAGVQGIVPSGSTTAAPVPTGLGGPPPQLSGTAVSPWGLAVVLLVAVSLLLGLAAAFSPRGARTLYAVAAGVFVAALSAALPVLPHAQLQTSLPWLVAMAPIAAAYLAVAFRNPVVGVLGAICVAAAIAVAFALVASFPLSAVLPNALFDLTIGAVLAIVIAAVRHGVTRANTAQRDALEEYSKTQLDRATEVERVRTDALVHDAVLTTLLQTASAASPESEHRARAMAANALRVLAHLRRSAELGEAVPLRRAFEAATTELDALLPHFVVESGQMEDLVLPAQAADALTRAMIEAMRNSIRRSGRPPHRVLRLAPLGRDGIRIVVLDGGSGPAQASEDLERQFGVESGALEQLHRVNGRAEMGTDPGGGARVTLLWGSIVMSGVNPLADLPAGALA